MRRSRTINSTVSVVQAAAGCLDYTNTMLVLCPGMRQWTLSNTCVSCDAASIHGITNVI